MNTKDARYRMKKTEDRTKVRNGPGAKTKGIETADGTPAAKSKSTFKRFTLGSILLFLFMLLYIPSLLNWLSGNSIARDIIRIGTIEEAINVNGIIVRDEEILKAPGLGGRYIAEIGEGEKTPAFSRIATVLNSTSDKLLQDMEDLNAKIVKARMEKAEKAEFFSEDLVKLDKEIGLQVRNMITACNNRSFGAIGKYRAEIGKIVEKKAEIAGESSADNYINSLKKQKENLQKQLSMNTVNVISNVSGIVSYTIDGYETVLTPKSLGDLTPKEVSSILEEYTGQRENKNKALAGEPLAKVIKGADIYIAAVVSSESAKNFKAGDKINLRINNIGIETSGVIKSVGKPENGKAVVTVTAGRGMDTLSSTRVVNVDFISTTEEGFKVPLKCLSNISEDGKHAEIMLIKSNVSTVRKVDIIGRDKEYAIITRADKEKLSLNLYDTYIMNPDKVKEGDIIEK